VCRAWVPIQLSDTGRSWQGVFVIHPEAVFIYKHYDRRRGVAIRGASASMHLGWRFQSYSFVLGGVDTQSSLLQGRGA